VAKLIPAVQVESVLLAGSRVKALATGESTNISSMPASTSARCKSAPRVSAYAWIRSLSI